MVNLECSHLTGHENLELESGLENLELENSEQV